MDIMNKLREIVKGYKNIGEIDENTSFEALGFDSLDKVDIMMQVEENFDIVFPDDIAVETVGELIEAIEKLVK